jgi:hypothetical protein
VPLDISIKSNRKHHKTVLYSKSNKNMVGQLFWAIFHCLWAIFSQKHLVTLIFSNKLDLLQATCFIILYIFLKCSIA